MPYFDDENEFRSKEPVTPALSDYLLSKNVRPDELKPMASFDGDVPAPTPAPVADTSDMDKLDSIRLQAANAIHPERDEAPAPVAAAPVAPKAAAPAKSKLPMDEQVKVDAAVINPKVRDYLKEKYGFGDELDDAALKAAQGDAALQKVALGLTQGLSQISAAVGNVQDNSAPTFAAFNEAADSNVKNILTRRDAKTKQLSYDEAMRKHVKEGENNDPNSDTSIAVRQMYAKTYPKIIKDIPGFDKLSAADAKEYVEKMAEARTKAEERAIAADAARSAREANQIEKMKLAKSKDERDTEDKNRRRTEAEEDKINKYTKEITKAKYPQALETVNAIEAIINDPKYKGDLPGFGVVAGGIPDALASDDAKRLRQLVQSLGNIELKDRSGAAVTPHEELRFFKEFGSGGFGQQERDIINGLKNYKTRMEAGMQTYEPLLNTSYRPDGTKVLDLYKERPGAVTKEAAYQGGILGSRPADKGTTTPPVAGSKPASPAAQPKGRVSAKTLADYATSHKKTPEEAKRFLEGQGYVVE